MDIDEKDVRLVLGIPRGPKLAEEMSNFHIADEKYAEVLERFKNRHGELVLLVTKMPSVVLGQANGADDFKGDFIFTPLQA